MAITEPQLRILATVGGAPAAGGPAPAGGRPEARVLTDRCAGCQECVVRCPTGALYMDPVLWVAQADGTACVGCRQCTRTCPFSAITVDGPCLVSPRAGTLEAHSALVPGEVVETRAGFSSREEAMAEAARCLQCPDPTCVRGCPAHNDIPAFIAALGRGDLAAAHEVLRATTVMPDVCARVCNQAAQCEGACTWSLAGAEPVSIGRLERFVADNAPVPAPLAPRDGRGPGSGLRVAVVGSGPAGAGAAWVLVESGANVTVYEKDATPGGLCDWGIPDFTLPARVAQRPWDQLTRAGVDLRCGTEVDAAQMDELLEAYDAVVLAHGAGEPLRLTVPGNNLEGVVDATTFLKGAKAALRPGGEAGGFLSSLGLAVPAAVPDPANGPGAVHRSPSVLVLGAGNTAMDVARTARRLGCRATCVDWMDERYALVRPDEVAEARAEGVEVRFLRTVSVLEGDGGRARVARLARTEQRQAGQRPKVLGGPPEELEVDLVVMAMGYRLDAAFAQRLPGTPVRRTDAGVPDRHWLASGVLATPPAGKSAVGRLSLGREVALEAAMFPFRPRVWVAGDALTGPSTVVEAMAQGRRAASALLDAQPRRPVSARRFSDSAAKPAGAPAGRNGHPGSGGAGNGNGHGSGANGHGTGANGNVAGTGNGTGANGNGVGSSVAVGGTNGDGGRYTGRPLRALVCYESAGGRTAGVARDLADRLRSEGMEATALPLVKVMAADLAAADLVVVGAWTEGLVVARVHPARAAVAWLQRLPRMAAKPVAVFCTYSVAPRGTLAEMTKLLEARGANVLAAAAFGGHGPAGGASTAPVQAFAGRLTEALGSLTHV